jgi:hypothetical protein
MTTVMLATYPEVFAGGAVLAGVPYRTAKGLQEGLESIFQGRPRSARRVGRTGAGSIAASGIRGRSCRSGMATPTPPSSRSTPKKSSSNGPTCTAWICSRRQMTVDGYPRRVWQGPDGEELIESYTITGMSHGAALDPGRRTASVRYGGAVLQRGRDFVDAPDRRFLGPAGRTSGKRERAGGSRAWEECGQCAAAESGGANRFERWRAGGQRRESADAGPGYASAAGSSAQRPTGPSASTCTASFRPRWRPQVCSRVAPGRRPDSRAPLGIDVPGIISTALEAAGVLKGGRPARAVRRRRAQPEALLAGKGPAGSCCSTTRAPSAAARCSMATPRQASRARWEQGRSRSRGAGQTRSAAGTELRAAARSQRRGQ